MLRPMLMTGAAIGAAIALTGAAMAGDGYFPSPTGWEGFYAGINGAYAQGKASDGNTTFLDLPIEGGIVGSQAGYNFVLNDSMVISLQGDLDWSWETGSYGDGATTVIGTFNEATMSDTLDWTGALVGRAGFTAGPLMFYGLGGMAIGSNTVHLTGTDGLGGNQPIESEVTHTQVGWTAGAGVSALMGDVSAFAEYRYTDYGTAVYDPAVGTDPVRLTDQQVRLGLDYHMR